jgi:PAS domain S-box-containing protein
MQLPEMSDTAVSNVVRLADGARRTRVLYAGDMEFAKAQFASVAPQLHLVPASGVLSPGSTSAAAPADAIDVALIDCGAPGVDPQAIVDAIRARGLDLPIVLALDPNAGESGSTKVTSELRVDDYTVKLPGWLARLTARLEFAIAHHRRRRSLDALQVSAERLRAVVESAPVCLARVASDGTILAMNEAAMKMVSADEPEHVLGKSLLSFVDAARADGVRRFIDTVSGGQPGSLEFETAPAAGTVRIVDTRAVPLSPDAKGRASALLVLRDATERKRLEASIAEVVPAPAAIATDAQASERESLRQQLDAALEECRRLQTEREALQGEIEETRARAAMVDHVRTACAAAEQQLVEMQVACQRLEAERTSLAEELATIRGEHEAALAERQAAVSTHETERARQKALLEAADAERVRLASRCEALEALAASLETRHAAERDEHTAIREQAEARLQRVQEADSLAAEREALLSSLAALRSQFDEMSGSLDEAEARHAAVLRDQRTATEAAEELLRQEREARARLAAERDELQAALATADGSIRDLETALQDARSGGAVERAEREATHRALEQRIEDLQARVDAAIAERDAISSELRARTEAADRRNEQLQHSLDDIRATRDAQAADSEADRRELLGRIHELQARVDAAIAERDAIAGQSLASAEAADRRSEQLQLALDEIRAARGAQARESEAIRRELLERVDELQARVQAAFAERDAIRHEMRLALEAAEARAEQLQVALNEARAARETQMAEGDAARGTLTHRVEELQTRLDAVMIDREALERALESARAEHAARLQEASADRESLRLRIEQRDREYAGLQARHAALEAERARIEEAAAAHPVAVPPAASDGGADVHDAQAAFREAIQILSGELQSAVETTRAQHAALLRTQPPGYEVIEERLRQTESECRALAAERDRKDATVRALQAEIEQLINLRREQRKELVRALQESEETERRSAARLAECVRLRHALAEAQGALQRLSKWAANQSVRLGSTPVGGHRTVSRIEAAAPRPSSGRDDGAAEPPLETSWS